MSVHVLPLTSHSQTALDQTSQAQTSQVRTSQTGISQNRISQNRTPARSVPPEPVRPETARLHLTRRGRLVLVGVPLMLAAAVLLAFLGFFTAPAMASGSAPEETRAIQVSVSAGDSLWSLATEFAPDQDPRTVVADIVELNNLTDTAVPAGLQLYVPAPR
ncbi:LysM peptidoglycan-binding domain-containing protein [Arthrobacter yangruifuii]|uniref:LysM peptidoglycan-binding domain-containing protein n=1 Tax=Arthrobacter yangruifuii TaxID=2606616 RepID=UPI001648DFD2|nr:LysM peptidoglycan-binding domain-containing protein [Arthrobacter yangruifuii]